MESDREYFDEIRIGLDEPVEQVASPLITVADIKLSPALASKIESLRAHVMICATKDCHTCSERKRRLDMVVEQFKAEMVALWDLRRKISMFQDNYAALAAFIEHNYPDGTVGDILNEYKKSQIKRI